MSYTGNPETDAKIIEQLEWAVGYYKIPLEDIAVKAGIQAPHPDKTGHYGHRFLTSRIIDGLDISFYRKLYREDGYNKASPRNPVEKGYSDISIANAPAVLPPEI